MKWISVKDKLPEHKRNGFSKKVVVFTEYGNYHMTNYDFEHERWCYPTYTDTITHWMPLPEPPKER